VLCVDADGDGAFAISPSCAIGTDCDDDDATSFTTLVDGDCDGSLTDDDCDDADPLVTGPCPETCAGETPAFDAVILSATLTSNSCSTAESVLSLTLRNIGTEIIPAALPIAIFDATPGPGVAPVLVVTLDAMTLVDGNLPLAPGENATVSVVVPAASVPAGGVYVLLNHAAETAFTATDGIVHTAGALTECDLLNNLGGPWTCDDSVPECVFDTDCAQPVDVCDRVACVEGVCSTTDTGAVWQSCDGLGIIHIAVRQGDASGVVTCRRGLAGDGSTPVITCDRGSDGALLITPEPLEQRCGP
jgi:hypothetical protein